MFGSRRWRMVPALLASVLALAVLAAAQQPQAKGKQHTLRGKVTEVGKDRLTVNHDRIEGYMGAMTMPYKVDKPDVLTRVKAGDQIEATVYEDDYTLYDVKVVPPPPAKQK
jgi:Cu/Ag efflux protein CusF